MRFAAALALVVLSLATPPTGAASAGSVPAAAQSVEAAEAALGLDRPARRLIQQGLRNEGFDPGTPDGLFGPRTRGALRSWQASRGDAATGYLDETQAELLRAAATEDLPAIPPPPAAVPAGDAVPGEAAGAQEAESPAPSEPEPAPDAAALVAVVGPVREPERCDARTAPWFFASATAAEVSACLAAGADPAFVVDQRVGAEPLDSSSWPAGRSACDGQAPMNGREQPDRQHPAR